VASVKKRPDGKWRARYQAPDGKWRAKHEGTKAAAQRWLDRETAKIENQAWVDPKAGKVTFGDYVVDWEKTKADVRRSTMANVRGRIRKHAKPYFGTMAVANVKPMHARAYVADLVGQGLAASTVKGIVLTTSQVFAQAVDDGIIARNPFANVAMPSDGHRDEMRFLDAGQVNELAVATPERYRAAIFLAAYGGLRAGELWALRVDRVNVLGRTVEVRESASEAAGWHAGPTKTVKVRTITIPAFLARMLGEHIGQYSDERTPGAAAARHLLSGPCGPRAL
jgi:integrase